MTKLVDRIKNIKFINNLDIDNKKVVLILIISAVVIYSDLSFILKAQLAGLRNQDAQITKLKDELATLERDLLAMQQSKSKQASQPQGTVHKAKRVISENQISDLLQDISKIANSNDVRILQIKPNRQEKALSADSRFNPGANFSVLYLYMDLSAGYHQLGKFINELENAQVFVIVQELKIEPQPGNYLKQKAALTLKTYVKK